MSGPAMVPFSELDPSQVVLIPVAEQPEFAKLRAGVRAKILTKLTILAQLDSCTNIRQSAECIAAAHQGKKGFAADTLVNSYYKWVGAKRNWRSLVPGYKGPRQLPEEFVLCWRTLALENNRSTRAAFHALRRRWKAGEHIPGYGTWRDWYAAEYPVVPLPPVFPSLYPRGWSQSNLYALQPDKAERVLKRRGRHAARKYFPHVIRDTSKLRPLEYIVIDDFETDVMTFFAEVKKVCRTAGLLALDVATRRRLAFGLKPRVLNPDTGAEQMRTNAADVRTLLYQIFATWGIPTDYHVTIICENATASISADLETSLKLLLEGRVTIVRTGLINHRTLANGFTERGGKPWEKGWIESAFNLMHNIAGFLPGQKGARYDLAPAELAARIAYAEGVLQDDRLTPEKLMHLRLPFMSTAEAVEAFDAVFQAMDNRTAHRLQGFDEVQEFRIGAGEPLRPWAQLALLSPDQQETVQIVPRMESPLERWQRLTAQANFEQVPDEALSMVLFTPRKVSLKNGRIHFALSKQTGITFVDAGSPVSRLPDGTELLGYYDERSPDCIHLVDMEGRFIGSMARLAPVDIRDKEGLAKAAGEVEHLFQRSVSALRERHAAEDQHYKQMRSWNERILEGIQPWELTSSNLDNGRQTPTPRAPDPAQPAAPEVAALNAAAQRVKQERQVASQRKLDVSRAARQLTYEDFSAATSDDERASSSHQFSDEEVSDLLSDEPETY